jgi:hypothetical protein
MALAQLSGSLQDTGAATIVTDEPEVNVPLTCGEACRV